MTFLKRIRFGLVSITVAVFVAALALQGCAGGNHDTSSSALKPKPGLDPSKEANTIKPTDETTKFFNAIKSADRIIIIDGKSGEKQDERDQEPLGVFYADGPTYWDVMRAVTSARQTGKEPRGSDDYKIRWYKKGYKNVGEAIISKDTGRMIITFPEPADTSVTPDLLIPQEELKVIEKAATVNRKEEKGREI